MSEPASRRRHAEHRSDPTADDGRDRVLLPALPDRPEDLAINVDVPSQIAQSTTPSGEPLQDDVRPQMEGKSAEPLRDNQQTDLSESIASKSSSGTPAEPSREKRGRTALAAKHAPQMRHDVIRALDTSSAELVAERSFYKGVRFVEDDIKRLRTELTARLRLQKEQLERMLQRFDRR